MSTDENETTSTELTVISKNFSEVVATRPTQQQRQLLPAVETLLLNGCGHVWELYIQPVLAGDVDHGGFIANKAIMGLRLMDADAKDKGILATFHDANAVKIGNAIVRVADKYIQRAPRTCRAAGYLTYQQ
jgi:hypothetical protein